MRFHLNIDCNNAAFADCGDTTVETAALELARILREIATHIEGGAPYGWFQTIRDINGNDVGRYAIKPDDYRIAQPKSRLEIVGFSALVCRGSLGGRKMKFVTIKLPHGAAKVLPENVAKRSEKLAKVKPAPFKAKEPRKFPKWHQAMSTREYVAEYINRNGLGNAYKLSDFGALPDRPSPYLDPSWDYSDQGAAPDLLAA